MLRRRSAASKRPNAPFSSAEWHGHLGRKVSVRYRLRGESMYGHTEVVGVVQSVSDAEGGKVTIVDRRGTSHVVRIPDVVANKLIVT